MDLWNQTPGGQPYSDTSPLVSVLWLGVQIQLPLGTGKDFGSFLYK